MLFPIAFIQGPSFSDFSFLPANKYAAIYTVTILELIIQSSNKGQWTMAFYLTVLLTISWVSARLLWSLELQLQLQSTTLPSCNEKIK